MLQKASEPDGSTLLCGGDRMQQTEAQLDIMRQVIEKKIYKGLNNRLEKVYNSLSNRVGQLEKKEKLRDTENRPEVLGTHTDHRFHE